MSVPLPSQPLNTPVRPSAALPRAARILACAAALAAATEAPAQVLLTFGAGSAVERIDHFATFDNVAFGTDLSSHAEDGLRVTVPATAFVFQPNPGFSGGIHYPNGLTEGPTTISIADGGLMQALEFNLGSGYPLSPAYFAYQVLLSGVEVGAGHFSADTSVEVVVGLKRDAGFDEVRFVSFSSLTDAQIGVNAPAFNSLAMDNLKVQAVPEAEHFAAGGAALLLGFAAWRASRRSTSGSPA